MDEWNGWNGQMDRQTDGQMDGRTDGWMIKQANKKMKEARKEISKQVFFTSVSLIALCCALALPLPGTFCGNVTLESAGSSPSLSEP